MKIIYWSGTGNTEAMANLIAEGITKSGKSVEVVTVDSVSAEDISSDELLVLGCPAMGGEVLEEDVFEPFITSLQGTGNGRKAILFGSYGWGDGEWMRTWEDQMKDYGFEVALEPLIVNEAPEGAESDRCIAYGENISNL